MSMTTALFSCNTKIMKLHLLGEHNIMTLLQAFFSKTLLLLLDVCVQDFINNNLTLESFEELKKDS